MSAQTTEYTIPDKIRCPACLCPCCGGVSMYKRYHICSICGGSKWLKRGEDFEFEGRPHATWLGADGKGYLLGQIPTGGMDQYPVFLVEVDDAKCWCGYFVDDYPIAVKLQIDPVYRGYTKTPEEMGK